MPFFRKINILFVFLALQSLSAYAEDYWRLRYSVPISSENKITRITEKKAEELRTSGHSGNLLFANGVGFGYSTVRTMGTLEDTDYEFVNHNLDLSYTFGDEMSLTIGVGRLIYGRGELTDNGVSFVTESSKGEDFFFNFGIPFIVGEFIIGYQKNYSVYDNFQSQLSGQSVILDDSVKLYSNLFNFGFGLFF